MPDLPDYYTLIQTLEAEAYSLTGGADASKSASPEVRDIYLATDTDKLYYCTVDAAWRSFFMSARLLTANSILYATTAYTPAALTVAASRIIGRKATGNIAAMTGAEALVVLGVTATAAELNKLDGVTASTAELNILDGVTADKDELNITDGLTATTAELNLLDLAGLTAGELLVATAATTAAWQSTGVKLSAPDISGVVTAAAALTLPAFTLNGDITLNAKYLDAGAGYFNVKTTQAGGLAIFRSIQDGAYGAFVQLRHESASPAANDGQRIQFYHRDGAGAIIEFAYIQHILTNIGNGTEASDFNFYAHTAGAIALAATLTGAGKLTLASGLEVGGAIDMNSHQINELADPTLAQDAATKAYADTKTPTKELFIPVVHVTGGAMGVLDKTPVAILTTATQAAFMSFKVPHDFTSITNAEIIVIPRATTATANWDILANYAAAGEAYNTHTETDTSSTYDVTDQQYFAVDISGILSSLAADDYVGVELLQSDSNHDVDVLGVRFKYS